MCECACSQIREDAVLQIYDATVCVDAYRGCPDCAPLIGFDVRVFNKQGRREWLSKTPKTIKPDEYGVLPSAASFEMFSIEDLVEVCHETGATLEGYDSLGAWMEDHGLKMVQDAMRKCEARKRKETP